MAGSSLEQRSVFLKSLEFDGMTFALPYRGCDVALKGQVKECQEELGLVRDPKDPADVTATFPEDSQTTSSFEITKLAIFGKRKTVIYIPRIKNSTKKKKKRKRRKKVSDSKEEPDGCKEVADNGSTFRKWPEESMYDLGCKPKVMYINIQKPLEEDYNVFGYIPDFLPLERELTVDEVNQNLSKSHDAALHRKSDSQTVDTKSKITIYIKPRIETVNRIELEEQRFKEEESSKRSMIAIGGKMQKVLENHYKRISEVESQLEHIRKERGVRSKTIDALELDPLETTTREIRALEDKEEELNRQKIEFLTYVKYRYDELAKASGKNCLVNINRVISLECKKLSVALPIYARRSDIVDAIKTNQVTVIVGETGCGKSTQIPQYLYEADFATSGVIVCTQPRKTAAISLALRVAEEMNDTVGQVIGYKVGTNREMTDMTKVLFVTDSILLNECLEDREFSSFSCIIIDEAHERTIFSDLLLGMIRKCLQSRPDLRLVITSATIDPEVFVKYFRGCPVLYVTGRQFPVEVEWKETRVRRQSFTNYESEAVKMAVKVHNSVGEGDILVFLTDPLETERCCETFERLMGEAPKYHVTIALHGKLQKSDEKKVFEPTPAGERKIIFATDIGETSLTIPTVRYVIDTGVTKEMVYDERWNMNVLSVRTISQSRATQRLGRAGRLCPGKCYRLYTREDYRNMDKTSPPEILCCDISLALLKLMDAYIDPLEFDYVTPPSTEAVEEARASLVSIGAVVGKNITNLGHQIAKLPLEPTYGALIYEGNRKGVVLEAIVIAAASGWNSILLEPKDNVIRKEQLMCHHQGGDQLTVLNAFKKWFELLNCFKWDWNFEHSMEWWSYLPREWRLDLTGKTCLDQGKEGLSYKTRKWRLDQARKWRLDQSREWCSNHSVIERAMFGIYEAAKDIVHIVNTSWNLGIRFTFRPVKTVELSLASLLFKVFNRNLSYCIGHPEAYYCIASKGKKINIIQSSVTMLCDDMPAWIVFDHITNITKKDFAVNVVPVAENLVLRAIKEGLLFLEVDNMKKKRMSVVCKERAGQQVLKEFFAPQLHHFENFQSWLKKMPDSDSVFNKRKGVLNVLALGESEADISATLTKDLSAIKLKHRREKSLERVGFRNESVRAVIGAGGSITNILMPEECKVVIINCPENSAEEISEENILKVFEQYGEVEECGRFNQTRKSTLWGYVVYRNVQSAIKAVAKTRDSSKMIALPNGVDCFMKKVQWSGVSVVESGYVTFSCEKLLAEAKACNFKMRSSFRSAWFADHEQVNTLKIVNVGQFVSENTFRYDLARALNIDPLQDILNVRMPRPNIKESENMRTSLMTQLLSNLGEPPGSEEFHLYFRPPPEGDTSLTAFCVVREPGDASVAWKKVSKHFLLKEVVCDEVLYDCSIYIMKEVFRKHKEELQKQMDELEDRGMVAALKHCKNKDFMMYLGAECPNALAIANRAVVNIISGDEVTDYKADPRGELLFSTAGQKMLLAVCDIETFIVIDERVRTISLHGSEENIERIKELIVKNIGQLIPLYVAKYNLKGVGKPEGFMKYLLDGYGSNLGVLEAEADSVELDYRNHQLLVTGPNASGDTALVLMDKYRTLFCGQIKDKSDDLGPGCVVCLFPVKGEEIYRLDCGHGYCLPCIKLHINQSINKKEFPIACIIEKCKSMFVWRDFLSLAEDGLFKLSSLVAASVSCFVSRHKKAFRYCITPLCPSVYRVTGIGTPFTCPVCRTKICTTCHTYYHSGLTCLQYTRTMKQPRNERRRRRK